MPSARRRTPSAGTARAVDAVPADVVLPDGHTYGEFPNPQIAEVYRTQEMPAMPP